MQKDFQNWHKKKNIINDAKTCPSFHEREIWFCYLGANVGFEQDGQGEDFQRPVVVIRKFNNEVFWAVPLSKTKRRGIYYFSFNFIGEITSVALLSQMRLVDARRLSRKIGNMNNSDFSILKEKLKALLP